MRRQAQQLVELLAKTPMAYDDVVRTLTGDTHNESLAAARRATASKAISRARYELARERPTLALVSWRRGDGIRMLGVREVAC